MHVRASEIKDLSRVMDLINQAKEYFKDNDMYKCRVARFSQAAAQYLRVQCA